MILWSYYGSDGRLESYHQEQTMLLSLSVVDFIPQNHKARVISALVDKMDLSPLYSIYCTTNGQNAYDPRMLVKLLFMRLLWYI